MNSFCTHFWNTENRDNTLELMRGCSNYNTITNDNFDKYIHKIYKETHSNKEASY